jgi:IS5 family transposase
MRQRFEQQITLGTVPIAEVDFQFKSRDELPPTLKALQYIFITPELNEKVFGLLEEKITSGKKKTGRPGMDLWHILVLSVTRHATGTNWDSLESWSNYHELLRMVMGVHNPRFNINERITFNRQSIIDNVSLIDEDLLYKINQMVVDAGHKMLKKKEDEGLRLKTDSFVVETNVHFPTDLNLLWDSIRKCLNVIESLQQHSKLKGWREVKAWRSKFKSLLRSTSQVVFKGKDEEKKKKAVKQYLSMALELKERCMAIVSTPPVISRSQERLVLIMLSLRSFCEYADKFCNQIERRLIKGEQIPAAEKVFSIFEPHTEWITKGKQNKKVELGLLTMITTDQYHFIVDYKVMEKERDHAQVTPLLKRIDNNFATAKILSHSFDKGFDSKDNRNELNKSKVELAVLPKKGRHTKEDKARESDAEFIRLRHQHSAIESNINMLEHHGLNRCMDKGKKHFKRYVGLSVLAYNLHILGNALLEADRKREERRQKRQMRMAA